MKNLPLLFTIAALGCGSVSDPDEAPPDGSPETADAAPEPPDAPPPDAREEPPPDALPPLGPFSSPEALLELFASNEGDPALTADGTEIFFSSSRAGGQGGRDIWTARRAGPSGPFGEPTVVVELSSAASDVHPEVSADGLRVYLVSNRIGGSGNDIFISARATRSTPWSEPALVDALSSDAQDHRVSISADGLVAVLDSTRGAAGTRELYLATRASDDAQWNTPAPITELDSALPDTNPSLSADGLAIYFVRDGDLFVARRPDRTSAFEPPAALPELDSDATENDPWISADERLILFTSTRTGPAVLYQASREYDPTP